MTRVQAAVVLAVVLNTAVASAAPVDPQSGSPALPAQSAPKRTEVVVYPILGWLPFFGAHSILPSLPELPGQPPGTGGGASADTNSSLNGAAMAGVSVVSPSWLFQFEFLWAGLSGEVERPHLKTTTDLVFGGLYGGRRIGHDLAVIGGVRRIELDMSVEIDTLPTFRRKPGIWDPLVGLDWRRDLGRRWTASLSAVGGGFGVGADVDASAHVRFDWKMAKHVRMVLGYGVLYLKLSNGPGDRKFTTSQTLNGPEFGLGIAF
ncbi:MAG: hypothetical protein NTY02_07960 [Acidobacteria bacterium]|nr:hypothetical protein [Acidobacteriota bacterium]